MAELSSPVKLRKQIAEELEQYAKEETERMIDLLIEEANKALARAAEQNDWHMQPIIDSAEKEWTGEGWIARWTYESEDGADIAAIFEFGAAPHEIEGNPWLHWESDSQTSQTTFKRGDTQTQTQRRDVESGQFAEQGDTQDVFAQRVMHPGIEAVGYIRTGMREAMEHFEVEHDSR